MLTSTSPIRDLVGPLTLDRGAAYASQGRVLDVGWVAPMGIVRASVLGSGGMVYRTAVHAQVRQGVLLPQLGICTCPVGSNCKHAAAALFAYMWGEANFEDPDPRAPWERTLDSLIGGGESGSAETEERTLGIQFELRPKTLQRYQAAAAAKIKDGVFPHTSKLELLLRPVQLNDKGRWVSGNLAWQHFRYTRTGGIPTLPFDYSYDRDQVEWFCALLQLNSFVAWNGTHLSASDFLSPMVWSHLAQAQARGIELRGQSAKSTVTVHGPVAVRTDIAAEGKKLRIRPALDVLPADFDSDFLGAVADHGVFWWDATEGMKHVNLHLATKVCRLHWARYMRGGGEPIEVWARQQLPHIGIHQFMLLNLPERLRWEVLYAVQQRAGRGGRIDPENTKAVVRIMEASKSGHDEQGRSRSNRSRHNMNVGVHLHQFARALRNAYDASLGRSAKDALVWDLDDVGFEPQPNGRRPRPRRRKCLDFGLITQPWLRDLALAWAREESQSYMIVKTHRAAVVASQALESRSDRGQDITALGNRDVDAIAEAVRLLTRVDNGAPCQTSFKRHIFAVFFDLITWGRRHGLLDGLPASFEPTRTRIHLPADPVVEKAGKAIPEGVQRQLDAQTDSLGRGFTHGMLTAEQTHQMFLTAYIVLRDTGRRTLEVASLRTHCLTRDAAGPVLIYDNHKARRPGRRLPILQSTADAINDWVEVRRTIPTSSQEYLFPGTTDR